MMLHRKAPKKNFAYQHRHYSQGQCVDQGECVKEATAITITYGQSLPGLSRRLTRLRKAQLPPYRTALTNQDISKSLWLMTGERLPLHIYLYLAKACCSSMGGEHPSGASDCQDRPHPDPVSS
ncbi:hypothetical protein STEG23_007738, partial [Scotinomys teguina]